MLGYVRGPREPVPVASGHVQVGPSPGHFVGLIWLRPKVLHWVEVNGIA